MSAIFSLKVLNDIPRPTLSEALRRARRLVSNRVGIISQIVAQGVSAEEPAVHWASSIPANTFSLLGQPALNWGAAVSVDPMRATIKAAGESIERYCAALYDKSMLRLATAEQLGCEAIPLHLFALFSEKQYAAYTPWAGDVLPKDFTGFRDNKYIGSGFHFARLNPRTPLRWVEGYALQCDRPVYVPAAFVYVPYRYDVPQEPFICDLISTGLACGHTRASALYRGILEVIERDAFMIVWQNRLPRPALDLSSVDDAVVRRLLRAIDFLPVRYNAILLTLDIPVPVFMVIMRSTSGVPPLTVVGMGTDLDPKQALILALEEACLSFCGMLRYTLAHRGYTPAPGFSDVVSLERHGLVHALAPELGQAVEFLTNPTALMTIGDLPNVASPNSVTNIRTLVEFLGREGYETVAVDITTPDIADAGFAVVRAIVPGFQPLDINHTHQHLGGKRLYDVPCKLGLLSRPNNEQELNPYPHPFP